MAPSPELPLAEPPPPPPGRERDLRAELIAYHRQKRDWFQFSKQYRQWHVDVLRFLEEGK
jgi:hypothetical protein